MTVKEPNRRLACLIAESSCSRAGLAKRVNQLGLQHGLDLRYDKTAVARWVKDGAQPRGIVPRLVAEVLGSKLGRAVSLEEIGMADEEILPLDVGLAYASTPFASVESAADLWRCDVDRLDFLVNAAFAATALTGPSRDWLITPAEDEVSGHGERAVGMADVHAVRAMSDMFGRLDNAFGGGHARSAVVQYLGSEAAPMLRGRYGTDVGRQLFSAVAELTLLAGWMAYDTCQHGLAQRYFVQALRLTQTADNWALGAHVLGDASNQAAYLGDGDQAVKLARAGKTGARGTATPTVQAMLEVREARGHAVLGDGPACRAALTRAETAFERSDPANDPPWISFFDQAEMSAQFAYCFRDLHAPAEAQRFIDASLSGLGEAYQRSRAFCQALQATVHIQQRELEQACAAGSHAIALITKLHSARGLGYIADLQRRLEPYRSEPAVRAFNRRAAELVGVAA